MKTMTRVLAGLAAAVALAGGARAEEGPPEAGGGGDHGGSPPPAARLQMTLGAAGLLEVFGSNETYGKIQSRQGLSRAQIEAAHSAGLHGIYRDGVHGVTLPFDMFYAIPGTNGTRLLRFATEGLVSRGSVNPTYSNTSGGNFVAQYIIAPDPATIFAFGITGEQTRIKAQNDPPTEIVSPNYGLRVDIVKKVNDHWGLAGRLHYMKGHDDTDIPLGFTTLSYDQDYTRLYAQADLVGTYTLDSLPRGWIFRPSFGAAWQRMRFDAATTSLGGTVRGTVGASDDYGLVSAKVSLVDNRFMPGHFAPFVTLGVEQEVVNDLDLEVDEPTILLAKVGGTMNLGNGAWFDVSFGHRQGTRRQRRDDTLIVHYGMSF